VSLCARVQRRKKGREAKRRLCEGEEREGGGERDNRMKGAQRDESVVMSEGNATREHAPPSQLFLR
jgi:hypothetical protein